MGWHTGCSTFVMNIQKLVGLATTGLLLIILPACGGASSAPVGTVEEDPTPPSGATKLPATNKDKSGTPAGTPKDPSATTPPTGTPPATPGTPPADHPGGPGGAGQPGQPGRISVNEHCCYTGKYFKCPNSAACFGGFDVNACLSTCAGPQDPCFNACFQKLDAAGAPKGCQSAPEPKGVDCANGSINL